MIPAALSLFALAILGVLAWHAGGNDQPAMRLAACVVIGAAAILTAIILPKRCRLPPLGWAWCLAVPVVGVALAQALPLGFAHPWAADAAAALNVPVDAWSMDPQLTLRAAAWAAGAILYAALAAILFRGERSWDLARAMVAVAAVHVVLALVMMATTPDAQEPYAGRLHGTFIYPNHAASFWGAGLALALLVARYSEDRWPWFAVGLLGLGVLFTGSRAGIIITALVCLPLVWGLLPRRGRPWYALATGIGLAGYLALIGISQTTARFDRLVDSEGLTAEGLSVSGRLGMWRAAVPLAVEAGAWGSGGGTAEMVFPRAGDRTTATLRVDHLHSDPLEWWLEYGWAGTLLAALGLAGAAWLLRRRGTLPETTAAIRVGACAGLALMALHSGVDLIGHSPAIILWAGLFAGLVAATTCDPELVPVRHAGTARLLLGTSGLAVLGAAVILLPWAWQDGRAASATVYLAQRLATGQPVAAGSDCLALAQERPAATTATALLQARVALLRTPPDTTLAAEALARCAVLAPGAGDAWIERARLAVARQEPELALTCAERAMAAAPASPYVQQHAVLCLDRSTSADRRRALITRLLEGDQTQPAWFFALAAEELGAPAVTAAVVANPSVLFARAALPWLILHAGCDEWLAVRRRVAVASPPEVSTSQWLPAVEILGTGARVRLPVDADHRAEQAERLDMAGLPLSGPLADALREDGEPWSLWAGSTALDDATVRNRWRTALASQRWRNWATRRLELISAADRAAAGDTSIITMTSDPRLAIIALAAKASTDSDRVRMRLLCEQYRTPSWRPIDQGRWTWLLVEPGRQASVNCSQWSGLVVDGAWRGWRRGRIDIAAGLTPGLHRVALITPP